jgi:hypothetical protein
MSASRNNVHFDNFFILIKDYCPRIRGLMVFDNELDFVWQDDSAQLAAKRVQPLLQVLKDGDTDDEIIDVDGAGFAELVKLKNEHGEMGLALCLSLEARQDAVPESVVQQRAFGLLGELLLADYQQSRALASKEDELNYMTDELTRRYEELNLIYKAEDQAMNIHHGRELLRQAGDEYLAFSQCRYHLPVYRRQEYRDAQVSRRQPGVPVRRAVHHAA